MWRTDGANLLYSSEEIRAAAILTNSYVAATVLTWTDDDNQSVLFIDFTIWSLTSMELKIEYSDDNSNYYQQTFLSIVSWTATASLWEYTFTASWAYEIANPFKAAFIKVSVKGTGTVTSSSCTITGIIWVT